MNFSLERQVIVSILWKWRLIYSMFLVTIKYVFHGILWNGYMLGFKKLKYVFHGIPQHIAIQSVDVKFSILAICIIVQPIIRRNQIYKARTFHFRNMLMTTFKRMTCLYFSMPTSIEYCRVTSLRNYKCLFHWILLPSSESSVECNFEVFI